MIWLMVFGLFQGCLELMHNGVAMSIQQAYCTLLSPNTSCTLNEYRTYAHLLRHGYRVLRHTPPTKSVQSVRKSVQPVTKSVYCDNYVQQKNEKLQAVLEVVDISDSKPRPSNLLLGRTETLSSSGTHARNKFSNWEKNTSFNQRTEPFPEVNEVDCVDSKPVSKVPTEEADVTLVYEQKGPVIQSCLKPKGSLVLFPDSQLESQSSSRTVNVTPIDIDDNELEISYVNRNVSVTLSPRKKERQDLPTPPESVTVKDVAAEVLSVDTSKESSGNSMDVQYEEQSTTVEESCSENLQREKHEAIHDSGKVISDADKSQTVCKVNSPNLEYSNVQGLATEETAQYNNTHKETEDSPHPLQITVSNSDITTKNKHVTVGTGNSAGARVSEKETLSVSSTPLQTLKVLASNISTFHKNQETLQKPMSTIVIESVAERKSLKTGPVVSENRINNVPSDDVLMVENNSNFSKSAVKCESDDVIEIQENSNDSSCIRTSSRNIVGMETNTNFYKVKNEWQHRRPKREDDDDIEIICDTTQPNISKSTTGKVSNIISNQNTENNHFSLGHQNIAETSSEQPTSAFCIKPDVEILGFQESSSNSGDLAGVHRETETRKRSHVDLDVKEECSSAKKLLLNINNWTQDSTETIETKPSSSQQINVINIEDDEARLTLAERKAIFDAIPSIENKFTIHVQAPKQDLLPPNVKPKQKDYYIQLWRLKADGFGGGPAQNALKHTNSFPMSQPVRQTRTQPENDGRINPWLPTAMFRPQLPPMMGFGNGLLPHPMFAQAIMMAQSLAMAQSMAMNFSYRRPFRSFRGRYPYRPYFRRGYKRRYNNNNRDQPYHRNQGQSNNSYQFSRNSVKDDSSDTQSRAPARNSKISDNINMQIVIDIDDESNEKLGRKGDSDDDVIECFEVVPSLRGRSRRKHGRTRASDNRYFEPSKKICTRLEKMWQEERSDIEEVSVVGTADKLTSRYVKREQESIEVTLSSDEEQLDYSMPEQALSDVMDEYNADIVPCLQPENCQSVGE
ncbi:hypothetical protein PR048_008512 [Dryococelus australis]|uniref:Uncharacterized protein n=1 Tax=Dryococelus australis TaxID=614101 RepID=A0ABQ9HXB9_9NEOP|nr:hypothetical protein PR048_008512 [Dryococelus australis]